MFLENCMNECYAAQGLPDLPSGFLRLVEEDQLLPTDHAAIQRLLVAAFPQHAEIFTQSSYWGARPAYRLWLETSTGEILAHLDFEPRSILVGEAIQMIAGVGEVAVDPRFHKCGLGRLLMNELRKTLQKIVPVPFGYLQCRPAVADFYTQVGWHRIEQAARLLDPDTHQVIIYNGPSMVLPACASIKEWPEGLIDLQGMPW
jgi:GNAT superfamily N-acetyltransferase